MNNFQKIFLKFSAIDNKPFFLEKIIFSSEESSFEKENEKKKLFYCCLSYNWVLNVEETLEMAVAS